MTDLSRIKELLAKLRALSGWIDETATGIDWGGPHYRKSNPYWTAKRTVDETINALPSLIERIEQLERALERVPATLHVLRGMCRTVGLPLGVEAADNILAVVADALAGRSEPMVNDIEAREINLLAELSGFDQISAMMAGLIRRAMRLIPEGKSLWWDEAAGVLDLYDGRRALKQENPTNV